MNSVHESSPGTGRRLPGFETSVESTGGERVRIFCGCGTTFYGEIFNEVLDLPCPACGLIQSAQVTYLDETEPRRMWPTPNTLDGNKARAPRLKKDQPRDPNRPGSYYTDLKDAVAASHPSTSSAAARPASPSATQGSARAQTTPGGSGPSSPVSFGKFRPDGSLLKTCQGFSQLMMDGSFEEFSGTFPRAGSMRSGTVYRQAPSAPRTYGTGSSSWPTPQAYSHGPDSNPPGITKLDIEVRGMWRTPSQRDWRNGGAKRPAAERASGAAQVNLNDQVAISFENPQTVAERNGQLNADWVSLLMGFSADWTVVAGSAE